MKMEELRIKALMAEKISGTASRADLLELDTLLRKYPSYQLLDDVLSNIETNVEGSPGEKEIEVQLDALWNKINKREADVAGLTPKKSGFKLKFWLAAAAVVIAVLCVGIIGYKQADLAEGTKYRTVSAAYGQNKRVVLPDGSIVKLNSGTSLTYPLKFDAAKRQVKLVGEAFFEVTKNPKKPFLVDAGNLTVRVLGTAFNVKAYKEDRNVETTLIQGKVQVVMNDEPDKLITLSPNEKLTVPKRAGNTKVAHMPGELRFKLQTVAVKPSENIEEIAWLDRKLAFNNTAFEDVARMIERKYDVKVVFQQEQLKSELITGVFENEALAKAFSLLQMSTDFNYEIKKDSVILRATKNFKKP
jgi:transmembrane sensor